MGNVASKNPQAADLSMFASPQRESTVDMVIGKIKELLLSRKLRPGDRLPNEIELTRSLSASRGSIREAMKILASFGVLEIRRGDGTYVSTSMSRTLFDPLLFQLIVNETDKRKLNELRELLELGIVNLVVGHASADDLDELKRRCGDMERLLAEGAGDSPAFVEADIAFHLALGRATHNELIAKIYAFTMDLFEPTIVETHRHSPQAASLAVALHKNIVKAVVDKDRELGRQAVAASLKAWQELY